jgi:predicted ATP-binding protein involved in virulence
VCEEKKELTFKDLMIVKTRSPHFFFEFKKNRTQMLKQREPPVEEPFYKKFKRKLEQEKIAE